MTQQPGPPPGWYPHPQVAGTQCYWNGAAWTTHMSPTALMRPVGTEVAPSGLIAAGWVTAFLFPLAGFIIGIVVMAKGSVGHGLGQLFASGAVMTLILSANSYA